MYVISFMIFHLKAATILREFITENVGKNAEIKPPFPAILSTYSSVFQLIGSFFNRTICRNVSPSTGYLITPYSISGNSSSILDGKGFDLLQ